MQIVDVPFGGYDFDLIFYLFDFEAIIDLAHLINEGLSFSSGIKILN